MNDYNEIFWDNVIRWRKYRGFTNKVMSEKLEITLPSYNNVRVTRPGVSIKKLNRYTYALNCEPADLFDTWTDEEWEKFVKREKEAEI